MPKLYRTTVRGTCVGVGWANVMYFTADTAEQVTTAVTATMIPAWREWTGNTTAFTGVVATEVGHLILDPDYSSVALQVTGNYLNAEHSDPQLAACLRLHTGLSGKKRRGRIFLAGVPDQGVEDGRIAAAWTGYLNTFITSISANFVGADKAVRLQVFSKKIFDSLTDIILDSYKPVTSLALNPVMSTMRSRKPAT